MNQDNVRIGNCTYTSAAAIAAGLCLRYTAANTVGVPSNSAHVPLLVATTTATASGEQIEVTPIEPGKEMRVRTSAAISAAALVEIVLTGGDAGTVITKDTGTARFVAVEGAASGDLALLRAI